MRIPEFREIQYHCFVSYTTREEEVREIQPTVDAFVHRLAAEGLLVAPFFYDHLCLERRHYTSRELRDALVHGVAESVCMVAFVSPGYLSSPWCMSEWGSMDGIQLYRGPRFPAILPIIWKEMHGSEPDGEVVMSRPYLKVRRWESLWGNPPLADLGEIFHETVRFIEQKQRELEESQIVQLGDRLMKFRRMRF
jgi:hypothetical protein